MDFKSKPAARQRRRGRPLSRPRPTNPTRSLRLNSMFIRERWNYGPLNTGTAGTVSHGDLSPSISSTSEYSILQSLFTEVRLIKATIVFTSATQTLASVIQGRLMVGTNMLFNKTTFTNPTGLVSVQNTANPKDFSTFSVVPHRYQMVVPPGLEFSSITNDVPSTATPYAGSPGAVVVWGDNLTAATNYFNVDIIAVFQLRGRQ